MTANNRVRHVFDLGADSLPILAHLRRDPALRPWLRRLYGLRVPGAWDGFEITIGAIVGQQFSVRGASTISARIARRCGEPVVDPRGGLTHRAPTPEAIAGANLERIGMPGARVATLKRVAEAVATGALVFDSVRPEALHESLLSIRGVGEWTAQHVALRLGEPDAFPATDLGLLTSAAVDDGTTPKALLERAEQWRSWRASAALAPWNASGG